MDEFEGNRRTRSRVIPTSELLSRQTAAVALTHSAERRDREMRQRAPTPATRPFATSASQRMAVNKGVDRIKQNSTACRTAPSTEIDTCGRKNPCAARVTAPAAAAAAPLCQLGSWRQTCIGRRRRSRSRQAPLGGSADQPCDSCALPSTYAVAHATAVRPDGCAADGRCGWWPTGPVTLRIGNGNPIWRGLCAGSNTRATCMRHHAGRCVCTHNSVFRPALVRVAKHRNLNRYIRQRRKRAQSVEVLPGLFGQVLQRNRPLHRRPFIYDCQQSTAR